jgi:hypothetical protein
MSAHQLFVYASILPNSGATSIWIDALADQIVCFWVS